MYRVSLGFEWPTAMAIWPYSTRKLEPISGMARSLARYWRRQNVIILINIAKVTTTVSNENENNYASKQC